MKSCIADDFDPRYYAQAIVRVTESSSTEEWKFLALVIQPDGIYLREWIDDAVTELGGVAVNITPDAWHDVAIELNGSRVSVRHLLAGANESQSIEANTTILDGDSVGFGVGVEADFEFDDVTTDVPVAASTALRYHYDAYGRVVGRTLNPGAGNETSQFFIYDNDRIVQELRKVGLDPVYLSAEWVYGTYIDEPLVMYRDMDGDTGHTLESTFYYLHDDLYNVIALAEDDGDVVERYTYDDFGAPTVWTETSPGTWEKYPNDTDTPVSSVGNPFMFTGRRWDEVLKLYDYRTRFYDPYLGHFLRIDTIGPWGDAANFGNPYTYVGNNPWSYTDPYGEGLLTWALAGDYEASDWTAAGVIAEASGLGLKGLFWTGPKNAVVGTVGVVRHPIQTAQGVGNFASALREDPNAVGTAIWEDIKSIPSDSERIGSIVFDVASSVATGGTVKAAASTGTATKFLGKIGDVASAAKKSKVIPKGQRPVMASTFGDGLPRGSKTYQTYTKRNPKTGKVYTGRTSGTGTPLENIAQRDRSHQMNKKGFGPAQLEKSSTNPDAIRGREQQLIERFGGAQSQGGTSGNQRNSISPRNINRPRYIDAADQEF